MKALRVGDVAPDFELPDELGTLHRLKEILAQGSLVLFFYPKDETLICTMEACAFRDSYKSFQELGAQVFGVSRDSGESHRAFRENHSLPYPLLSDPRGELAARYGVTKKLAFLPGRTTFVVDRGGVLRLRHDASLSADSHVSEALACLRALKS